MSSNFIREFGDMDDDAGQPRCEGNQFLIVIQKFAIVVLNYFDNFSEWNFENYLKLNNFTYKQYQEVEEGLTLESK